MVKTLLINPPILEDTVHSAYYFLPYGLAVLKSFLQKHNRAVTLRDLNMELKQTNNAQDIKLLGNLKQFHTEQLSEGNYSGLNNAIGEKLIKRLIDFINIKNFDVIGIGIISVEQAVGALLIAHTIKHYFNKTVVIGGPYVTLFGKLFFAQYSFLDYAILGSGEKSLQHLLQHIEGARLVENIPSLLFRKNDQVVFNDRKVFEMEDQLIPDYDGLNLESYGVYGKRSNEYMRYMVSCGCSNNCSFCMCDSVDGRRQVKSVHKAIKDLLALKEKYKIKAIDFTDANFNKSLDYLQDLCDALITEKVGLMWRARMEPKLMSVDLLVKMKQAGCRVLSWGIESGSEQLRRRMGKTASLVQAAAALKASKQQGIKNVALLISEFPYETVHDIKNTEAFLRDNRCNIDAVFIYPLSIWHGSRMFNTCKSFKIKLLPKPRTYLSFEYSYKELAVKRFVNLRSFIRRNQQKRLNNMISTYFPEHG